MVERVAESRMQLVDQSFQAGFAELAKGLSAALGDSHTLVMASTVSGSYVSEGGSCTSTTASQSQPASPPSATLPAWTIVEPLPPDELLGDYHDAEAATGIAWYWLAAIHLQETRMGRIIGTSSA